jgi:hypothetical protein
MARCSGPWTVCTTIRPLPGLTLIPFPKSEITTITKTPSGKLFRTPLQGIRKYRVPYLKMKKKTSVTCAPITMDGPDVTDICLPDYYVAIRILNPC